MQGKMFVFYVSSVVDKKQHKEFVEEYDIKKDNTS